MKCTDCNRPIKPVVAIDIDGTMGMYHKHFLEFAAGYLNQTVYTHYVGTQPFKEWFCMTYRTTPDVWHDIKLAYRQGSLKRTMPMYPDAADLCKLVSKAGAELWVTTTRPYIRHDNIDPDTREWLRRNGIRFDFLIYDGHKYHKLRQLVGKERVCAVLDDLFEEIVEASSMFGHEVPILRVNSFNTEFKGRVDNMAPAIPIATNLEMAGRLIIDRIKCWKEHYGTEPVRRDGEPNLARVSDPVPGQVK